MVKEAAFVAALIAAMPASALAQSPCGGPREMTVCEAELYEAGVVWEGRARESRVQFQGCLEKLRTRTSTVVNNLFVPQAPQGKTTTIKHDLVLILTAGVSGLGLGVVLGVLLGSP